MLKEILWRGFAGLCGGAVFLFIAAILLQEPLLNLILYSLLLAVLFPIVAIAEAVVDHVAECSFLFLYRQRGEER